MGICEVFCLHCKLLQQSTVLQTIYAIGFFGLCAAAVPGMSFRRYQVSSITMERKVRQEHCATSDGHRCQGQCEYGYVFKHRVSFGWNMD